MRAPVKKIPRAAGALLVLLLVASEPRTVVAHVLTATRDSVQATLHYQPLAWRIGHAYELTHLTIVRRDKVVLNASLPEEVHATYFDEPNLSSFRVIDLNGDGEPEVLLTIYSGGAHCCFSSVLYGFDRTSGHYIALTRSWGDFPPSLHRYGGTSQLVIVHAASSFAYTFSSFAGTGFPIEILGYTPVKLVDLVACYPNITRDDADHWWHHARENPDETTGFLAAYAADLYRLGEGDQAMSAIRGSRMHGVDNAYLWHLYDTLRSDGYTRPRVCL